jgi:SAM-dependent methyltransferase
MENPRPDRITSASAGQSTRPQASWRQALRSLNYHVGAMIRWRWLARAVAPFLDGGALRVLDAGSGNGDYAFRLARRYTRASFHGVDVDAEHVSACQARLRAAPLSNLIFAQGDLTRSQGTNLYDLIYNVDVLEHIADDRAAIANLARALRPGGWLIIHTPLALQRHWLRRFDVDRCPRADHVRQGYDEQDLKTKVREADLEIASVRYTHGRWGTLAWELWQLARPSVLARTLLWPLAMLLIGLEMASPSSWHNCILLEAKAPLAQPPSAS